MEYLVTTESLELENNKKKFITDTVDKIESDSGFNIEIDEYVKKSNNSDSRFDIDYIENKHLDIETLDEFKQVVKITFNITSDNRLVDDSLINKLKDNKILDNISVTFFMGKTPKDGSDAIINKYEIVAKFSHVYIQKPHLEELVKSSLETRKDKLVSCGIKDFIDKYDIKDYEGYIRCITLVTRDLNKYAKMNPGEIKKMSYQIKDWTIKLLIRDGFIDEVKKHKINESFFGLFYTKILKPDSDERISFHVPPNRFIKFGLGNDDLDEEIGEYNRSESGIHNEEMMLDYMDIVNSNFLTIRFIDSIKAYIDGKI